MKFKSNAMSPAGAPYGAPVSNLKKSARTTPTRQGSVVRDVREWCVHGLWPVVQVLDRSSVAKQDADLSDIVEQGCELGIAAAPCVDAEPVGDYGDELDDVLAMVARVPVRLLDITEQKGSASVGVTAPGVLGRYRSDAVVQTARAGPAVEAP